MLKVIRWFVGRLILLFEKVSSPQALIRSETEQSKIDAETSQLVVYQYEACPFCLKVRRQIKRLGLKIELRDALRNAEYKKELMDGGGMDQVPCLRIDLGPNKTPRYQWMYESSDINAYLQSHYGK